MKRKIILGAVLLIVISLAVYFVVYSLKHSFRATSTTQINSAYVTVDVTHNGTPDVGLLTVTGDTSSQPISSQDGSFQFTLNKSVPSGSNTPLSVRSISFQSFVSNAEYELPITPLADMPLTALIPNNTYLHLWLEINTLSGSNSPAVILHQYVNGGPSIDITHTGITIK